MNSLYWLAPVLAVVALIFAAYKAAVVKKAKNGNDRMQEIAAAISEGAKAFLYSEYKFMAIFIVVLFLLNFVGGIVGLSLGINWFNALVVGIFGAPGVVLLLLLKYLL